MNVKRLLSIILALAIALVSTPAAFADLSPFVDTPHANGYMAKQLTADSLKALLGKTEKQLRDDLRTRDILGYWAYVDMENTENLREYWITSNGYDVQYRVYVNKTSGKVIGYGIQRQYIMNPDEVDIEELIRDKMVTTVNFMKKDPNYEEDVVSDEETQGYIVLKSRFDNTLDMTFELTTAYGDEFVVYDVLTSFWVKGQYYNYLLNNTPKG